MNRIAVYGAGLLLVLGLAVGLRQQGGGTTAGEAATPPKVGATKRADTVRVTAEQSHQLNVVPVENVRFLVQKPAIGQIAFNEDASTPVLTPFSGRVTRLLAKIGDQVRRGSPLFEIDSPEVVQAQTDLIAALQALEKSKAQLALSRRVLDRQTGLYEAKAAAMRDLDQARNDYAGAESDNKTAQGTLLAARNRLRVLGRDDAEIARVERERVVNPLITVNAPIDGTVTQRKVGPGQYVRSDSGETLYTIADLSTMWLKVNVSENDIANVRVGQEIEVRVNALPDRPFVAHITSIGATSDPVTHRVVVRSEIPNPDGVLKPEMFARFRIATGEGEEAPAVPVEAVVREGEAATVWVETEPNVYQRRQVQLAMEQEGRVRVDAGLKPGERVVGRGAIFLDNEWKD